MREFLVVVALWTLVAGVPITAAHMGNGNIFGALPGVVGAVIGAACSAAVMRAVSGVAFERAAMEIVRQLDEHGESYGLELVKRSGGILKRGIVYLHLSKLEHWGVVVSRKEPRTGPWIGIPRRIYRLAGGNLHRVTTHVGLQ